MRLQLGSYSSEPAARAAWSMLVSQDEALKGRTLHLENAVVHGRNVVRVQIALRDRSEAAALRSELADVAADSFVIG